ncbi:MAG: DUF4384 domain-containing protein [Kofleriaceae bacterium]|nr:DUF4384 domain-containing protein [Kofleriaceae bacterium]
MAERTFTDLELERFLAGDLPAARAAELDAKATAADRTRLDELRAEHQAFLAEVDVGAEVRAIGKKLGTLEPARKGRATWWRWIWTGGALAAAAAVLLVIVLRKGTTKIDEDTGIKGGDITLVVHVASNGDSRRLASGDEVAPGARIRFEVATPKKGFVAVVGVDGAGETTVYFPYGGADAAAVDPHAGGLLPGAIALDATPGAERFFALYSEEPFALATVVPALREGKPLPAGFASAEVVLQKQLP